MSYNVILISINREILVVGSGRARTHKKLINFSVNFSFVLKLKGFINTDSFHSTDQ